MQMLPFALLAEEMLTGTGLSGWSAFGLSGLILCWLFLKHLPDKDKQIKEIIKDHQDVATAKDGRLEQLIKTKDDRLEQLLGVHQRILDDKDKQIERMLATKNEQIKVLTDTGTVQIRAMLDNQAGQVKLMHEQNQAALQQVITHCENDNRSIREGLERDFLVLNQTLEELSEAIRDTSKGSVVRRKYHPAPPPHPSPNLTHDKGE